AATEPIGAVLAGCTSAADGLVAGEGAVRDRGRAATLIVDAAASAGANDEAAVVSATALRLVAGEGAIAHGQANCKALKTGNRAADPAAVEDAPTAARVAAAALGQIVVERAVGDGGHSLRGDGAADTLPNVARIAGHVRATEGRVVRERAAIN